MYTIGEFSNLAHVSARSLRYYDAMGLLRPAHMGENGYRYYTGGQLPALAKIETLKSYGFTLAEVKELLLLPETELAHRIHVRRISAYAQLNEMRRVIRRMEAAIVQMEGTSMANDTYHVILMQAPAHHSDWRDARPVRGTARANEAGRCAAYRPHTGAVPRRGVFL